MKKLDGCLINVVGMNQIPHQLRNWKKWKCKDSCGYQKVEYQCIVKYRTDFAVIFFAVSSGNHYLRSLAKAKSNKINSNVKHSANSRSSQCHFAHTPEKSSIRYVDNILCYQRQENGVGYLKYFFVGIHKNAVSDTILRFETFINDLFCRFLSNFE